MSDWTLDLGKIGFSFLGAYDSSVDYPEMTIVKHNGKIWGTEEATMSGEEPGVTGKWKLWVDSDNITYPADSVIASDGSGDMLAIPNAEGMLTYNPVTGFNYLPIPEAAPGATEKINLLPSTNNNNYGLSFVTNKGDVKSAGYYNSNSPHNGVGANTPIFTAIPFNGQYTGTIVDMIVTYNNRYILTSTGEVWSMGYNGVGQTGHPTSMGSRIYMMTKLPLTNIVSIAVSGGMAGTSYNSFMAASSTGKLYAAGYGGYGHLGTGNNSNVTTGIVEVPGITNAVSIWGGVENRYGGFTYLSNEPTNNVYSTGYNGHGALGIGNTSTKNVFTQAITETGDPIPKVIKVIRAGTYSSYASMIVLTETGRVYTTGSGAHGNGGWGNTSNKNKLQKMPYEGYVDITTNDCYAGCKFLLRGDKKVDFMGYNGYQIAGMTTVPSTYTPFTLVGPHSVGIIKVITNTNYNKHVAYFLNENGEVYHTGDRGKGKTGGAPNEPSKLPTKIPLPEAIVDMHLSGSSDNVSVIFKSVTGKGYVLGYNGHGQLGLGIIVANIPAVTKINL